MKEMITIVNEHDEVIGARDRAEYNYEEIHRAIGIWIENSKGEVLLQKRSENKASNPGKYTAGVTGFVCEGESYDDAAAREMQEEIGVDASDFILEKRHKRLRIGKKKKRFSQWYYACIDKKESEFVLQEEEVAEVKWVSKKELVTDVQEHPEKYTGAVTQNIPDFIPEDHQK